MTIEIHTTVQSDSVTGHVSVRQSIEVHVPEIIEAEGEEVPDEGPPSLYPGPVKAESRPHLRVVKAA